MNVSWEFYHAAPTQTLTREENNTVWLSTGPGWPQENSSMYRVYRKHLLYCLVPIIPDAFKGTVLGQNRLCCSNQETHISTFYQNNHLLSPQFRLFILLFAIMKVHCQLFYHEEALPASVFRLCLSYRSTIWNTSETSKFTFKPEEEWVGLCLRVTQDINLCLYHSSPGHWSHLSERAMGDVKM